MAAIVAGLSIGIAQVPVASRYPDLVRVLPETDFARLPVFVVTHEDLRNMPRIRVVFDALVSAFGSPSSA